MDSRPSPTLVRRIVKLLLILVVLLAIPLVLLAGCQSRLIYFPRPYGEGMVAAWQADTGGRLVDYVTAQGKQRAFLQGELDSPRRLWVVCGGNGTVALDWSRWLEENAQRDDAWLLVDFPGYGDSAGSPTPERIRENLATAVPLAWREVGGTGDPDPERLRFFGHSLGAAACLMAASDFGIQRGVLIAPFTSTMDMSRAVTGLPLGFLVTHRFDNRARLAELAARGPGEVVILHGSDDEAIPVEMSRTLAAERKDVVRFHELEGGRHNTLVDTHGEMVLEAIREVMEP